MIEVVQINGINFKIYKTKQGTLLAKSRFAGVAKAIHRASRDDLDEAMKDYVGKLTGNRPEKIAMTPVEWQSYRRCITELGGDYNVLWDAVRLYKSLNDRSRAIGIPDVCKQFLEAKDDKSERYVRDMKWRVQVLVDEFHEKKLHEVTVDDLEGLFKKKGYSPRTINNFRSIYATLWNWAKHRGYFAPNNEAEKMRIYKDSFEEITVASPDMLQSLLKILNGKHYVFVCIGAWAGLRSAEIERLHWEDIIWEHKVIEVKAGNSKTGNRRLVPMPECLIEAIKPFKKNPKDRVAAIAIQDKFRDSAKEVWGKWYKNILRHSFITYRLAELEDVAKVALEAGNSSAKIFSNYRSLRTVDGLIVTKELSKKWFTAS